MYFYKCCYCCFSKRWVLFSRFCHFTFSKSSRSGFTCIATTHLVSSGWVCIICHCFFFTRQRICMSFFYLFSLFSLKKVYVVFHVLSLPFFEKSSGCSFPCVVTEHLISSSWISICRHCCFKK